MKVFGVGGHAKVVIDTARVSGRSILAVYDDDKKKQGEKFCGFRVEGLINDSIRGKAVIAIGANTVRQIIDRKMTKVDWDTLIHPTAIISKDVEIGEGTVVMAGAIIQSGTVIGRHCIINTGACVDHDSNIGDYSHIAPNSSIAGGVTVGTGSLIGIGSSVAQYLTIGEWTTVGAGAVVIENLPGNCTAVGVPAKPIKSHDE